MSDICRQNNIYVTHYFDLTFMISQIPIMDTILIKMYKLLIKLKKYTDKSGDKLNRVLKRNNELFHFSHTSKYHHLEN